MLRRDGVRARDVEYTGPTSNTYTGLTTVAGNGTLQLDQTTGFAVDSNIQIGTGMTSWTPCSSWPAAKSLPTANVTVNSDGYWT